MKSAVPDDAVQRRAAINMMTANPVTTVFWHDVSLCLAKAMISATVIFARKQVYARPVLRDFAETIPTANQGCAIPIPSAAQCPSTPVKAANAWMAVWPNHAVLKAPVRLVLFAPIKVNVSLIAV